MSRVGTLEKILNDNKGFPDFNAAEEEIIKSEGNKDLKHYSPKTLGYYYLMQYSKMIHTPLTIDTASTLMKCLRKSNKILKTEFQIEKDYYLEASIAQIVMKIQNELIFNTQLSYREKTSILTLFEMEIEGKSPLGKVFSDLTAIESIFYTIHEHIIPFLDSKTSKKNSKIIYAKLMEILNYPNLRFLNLFELACIRTIDLLRQSQYKKRDQLEKRITSKMIESLFPRAFQIIKEVDTLLPDFFCTQNAINPIENVEKSKYILIKYKPIFDDAENTLLNTPVDSPHPPVEEKLLSYLRVFLRNFKELLEEMITDFNSFEKYKSFRTLTNAVCSIARASGEVQFIYFELLMYSRTSRIHYLFKPIYFEDISDKWSLEFYNRATRPPFIDILRQCFNSGKNFEEYLWGKTKNIKLITMPALVAGKTSDLQIIALINTNNETGSVNSCRKGATFYSYIHELAHLLQRADCVTHGNTGHDFSGELKLYENNVLVSDSQEKEGGRILEELLFGKKHHEMWPGGEKFLFSKRSIMSCAKFSKKFLKKNVRADSSEESTIMHVHSLELPSYIGECANTYNRLNNR